MNERVITPAELLQLRTFIRESNYRCDNTHKRTAQWLTTHGLKLEGETLQRIQDCGGCCCDCEIGWNFPATEAEIAERIEYYRKERA
jgi:Protein of unknown function (DUF2695)